MNKKLSKQAINFTVPNPSCTNNLSLPLYQGAGFNSQWNAWQIIYPHGFMKFNLHLDEPQCVLFTLNMCCMMIGKSSNNPITISVNNNVLITGFEPHYYNFGNFYFFIPTHWLNTGNNIIIITLDASATSRVSFKSVGVEGQEVDVSRTSLIDFTVPNPVATDMVSLTQSSNCCYSDSYRAWRIGYPYIGYMKFNLALRRPCLLAVKFSMCSMSSGGHTNNPLTITINNHILISHYDPHIQNFHDVTLIVPPSWLLAGNNEMLFQQDSSATTNICVKNVGIESLIVPDDPPHVQLKHRNGNISILWNMIAGATSYNVEFYESASSETPVKIYDDVRSVGLVLPMHIADGVYRARLSTNKKNVTGSWSDFAIIDIKASIFLLSKAGKQAHDEARTYLNDIGVQLKSIIGNTYFEGYASDEQLTEAGRNAYFSYCYSSIIPDSVISDLPDDQKQPAELWNFYLSDEYQKVVKDNPDEGKSWGDGTKDAAPGWTPATTESFDSFLKRNLPKDNKSTLAKKLTGEEFVNYKSELSSLHNDETVGAKLAQATAHLGPEVHKACLDSSLTGAEDFFVAEIPPCAGKIAVGVVYVNSSHTYDYKPQNWKVQADVAVGANTMIIQTGENDPMSGDEFTVGGVKYTVQSFNPSNMQLTFNPNATAAIAANTALSFTKAERMGPQFSSIFDLNTFKRQVPAGFDWLKDISSSKMPKGWYVNAAKGAPGMETLLIEGGTPAPKPGDQFTLNGIQKHKVTAFDSSSKTISFTPGTVSNPNQYDPLIFENLTMLDFELETFDVEVDVGFNYDGKPWLPWNTPEDYWLEPAMGKVNYNGTTYSADWNGVKKLQADLKSNKNAQFSVVLFVSAFPSQWFAFAQYSSSTMVLSSTLLRFDQMKSGSQSIITALNNRDEATLRDWLKKKLTNLSTIITPTSKVITSIVQKGHQWELTLQIPGISPMKFQVILADDHWISPDRLYVFEDDPWSLGNISSTVAHESLHLFGAPDEYTGVGTPCSSCGGAYGINQIPNGNCGTCANPQQECIMSVSNDKMCSFTETMIGWSDILVEITFDSAPGSGTVDDLYVKFSNDLVFKLENPLFKKPKPGEVMAFDLGITGLKHEDLAMIAIGADATTLKDSCKIKKLRVWVGKEKIYDKDNLGITISNISPWWVAPVSPSVAKYCAFNIIIDTGRKWFAGTADFVDLTLGGKKVRLNPYRLLEFQLIRFIDTDFDWGDCANFIIDAKDVDFSKTTEVIMEKAESPWGLGGDDWYPARIRIIGLTDNYDSVTLLDAPINQWLTRDKPTWKGQIHIP